LETIKPPEINNLLAARIDSPIDRAINERSNDAGLDEWSD